MPSLVSIVTPCFNSINFIQDTVKSVLVQSYSPIEYIVMDGGSTDGTVELLRQYEPLLTLVSEPDRGQSDAINKGWRRARGDILAWLNADDYYSPDTVEMAVGYLDRHPEAGWVYGYYRALDASNEPSPFRQPVGPWSYERLLHHINFIVQPTVFLRRHIIEEFGYLREDLHYLMDHEYWLRIGQRYPGHLVPKICVTVRWYRGTKTTTGGIPRLNELKQVVQTYGASELPAGYRHEWVTAHLEELGRHLRKGDMQAAGRDIREIWRYPSTLPRSFAKLLVRAFIPPRIETKLRQWFVRENV
jgi:glycosyltransferase involved in cell wall biosynthesis